MFYGDIFFLKKGCVGVCKVVFKRTVAFKNCFSVKRCYMVFLGDEENV